MEEVLVNDATFEVSLQTNATLHVARRKCHSRASDSTLHGD